MTRFPSSARPAHGLMPSALLSGCFLACLGLLLLLGACARSAGKSAPTVPRADPAYAYWLEQQSVLGMAPELARIVSGSSLPWQGTAQPVTEDVSRNLVRNSPALWLHVQPATVLTAPARSVLAELAAPETVRLMQAAGIDGLFVAPTDESGADWNLDRSTSTPLTRDDATSIRLAPPVGTEDEYLRLQTLAESARLRMGGDLLPAAPGLGPDFFLAGRAVRDYPGAWLMIEVPRPLWNLLPPPEVYLHEWNPQKLNPDQINALAAQGIMPRRLTRDTQIPAPTPPRGGQTDRFNGWHVSGQDRLYAPVAAPAPAPAAVNGSWAATGPIIGIDGTLRRWIYRYHLTPQRPVLNWDDPSAAARRMLSASVIRQVGLLRNPLVGMRMEPLFGLDRLDGPTLAAKGVHTAEAALNPGPSALLTLSREVRRYGGAALERTLLPLPLASLFLRHGADFVMDTVTAPAAELALLTGQAQSLRTAMDAALQADLPQRRLCRPLTLTEGLLMDDDALAHLSPLWAQALPVHGRTVYATAPALAAMRLDIAPDAVTKPENRAPIRRLHGLLLTLRGSLPGMVWVTGQDLQGVTHAIIPPNESPPLSSGAGDQIVGQTAPLPAWSLLAQGSIPAVSRQGIGRGVSMYPPLAEQVLDATSFMRLTADISRMRASLGIAAGRVIARLPTRAPGSFAVFTRLPSGQGLVTVANFADHPVTEILPLPAGTASLREALGAADAPSLAGAGAVTLTVPAFTCRVLLAESTGAPAPQAIP